MPAGGSEVVRSNASPVDGTMKEPAGRAHVNVAKRKLGILGPHYDDPEDYDFDDDYEDDDYYDDEDGEEGEGGANEEASAEEAEEELRWKETEAPEAFAKNLAKMKKEAEKKAEQLDIEQQKASLLEHDEEESWNEDKHHKKKVHLKHHKLKKYDEQILSQATAACSTIFYWICRLSAKGIFKDCC